MDLIDHAIIAVYVCTGYIPQLLISIVFLFLQTYNVHKAFFLLEVLFNLPTLIWYPINQQLGPQ